MRSILEFSVAENGISSRLICFFFHFCFIIIVSFKILMKIIFNLENNNKPFRLLSYKILVAIVFHCACTATSTGCQIFTICTERK